MICTKVIEFSRITECLRDLKPHYTTSCANHVTPLYPYTTNCKTLTISISNNS